MSAALVPILYVSRLKTVQKRLELWETKIEELNVIRGEAKDDKKERRQQKREDCTLAYLVGKGHEWKDVWPELRKVRCASTNPCLAFVEGLNDPRVYLWAARMLRIRIKLSKSELLPRRIASVAQGCELGQLVPISKVPAPTTLLLTPMERLHYFLHVVYR